MRDAIDRVAVQIHEHNKRSGKNTTFDEARRVAVERGVSHERRNPSKTRSPKGGQ
jgi:hypothetical protein